MQDGGHDDGILSDERDQRELTESEEETLQTEMAGQPEEDDTDSMEWVDVVWYKDPFCLCVAFSAVLLIIFIGMVIIWSVYTVSKGPRHTSLAQIGSEATSSISRSTGASDASTSSATYLTHAISSAGGGTTTISAGSSDVGHASAKTSTISGITPAISETTDVMTPTVKTTLATQTKPTAAIPTTRKPTTAVPTTRKPTTAVPTTRKPTTAVPNTKKPPEPTEMITVELRDGTWLKGIAMFHPKK